MKPKSPKIPAKDVIIRRKGPQRPSSNRTKGGKVFGNWQPPRKGAK